MGKQFPYSLWKYCTSRTGRILKRSFLWEPIYNQLGLRSYAKHLNINWNFSSSFVLASFQLWGCELIVSHSRSPQRFASQKNCHGGELVSLNTLCHMALSMCTSKQIVANNFHKYRYTYSFDVLSIFLIINDKPFELFWWKILYDYST